MTYGFAEVPDSKILIWWLQICWLRSLLPTQGAHVLLCIPQCIQDIAAKNYEGVSYWVGIRFLALLQDKLGRCAAL